MSTRARKLCLLICLAAMALCAACGGGGASNSQNSFQQGAPSSPFTITTTSILPGTLSGRSYSTTLTAVNGRGALHWSIARISDTTLFVDGLSIDPNTGVISGTVNFMGTGGFIATVTDSSSPARSTNKGFTITASPPLTAGPDQSFTAEAFRDIFVGTTAQGGVPPLRFSVTSGSLPAGLKLNSDTGGILGSAYRIGTSQFTVTITDSLSPPEVVSQKFTIRVTSPPLFVANSIPSVLRLNRPFSGKVIAVGGVPPYSFSFESGQMPPGLGPLANDGNINGTPTSSGQFFFTVRATDSNSPASTATGTFFVTVSSPLGRNDTPATATAIDNGFRLASLSPYIDPPDGTPSAVDHDYYKLVSLGGTTVHLVAQALFSDSSLDTVLEIVDGNGVRLSTCQLPGDTSGSFNSPCLNDDIGGTPHNLDSALDIRVPGPTNEATPFFAHVLDWRGNARPDMRYSLTVSGAIGPLTINPNDLIPGARGRAYEQILSASNGTLPLSWSLDSGTLPAGLNLNSSGSITGTPTTVGNSNFTLRVTDAANPPQTVTAQKSILIVEPLRITSSATLPDACVNQPYSFAVQTSGGAPPFFWSFSSNNWVAINLNQSTGVFSGTGHVTGTFTGRLGVSDATRTGDLQTVTLTVKQCP